MVTIPEFEGPFLPLLRIVQDKSTPTDDRVDAYFRFTERLREEEDVFVMEVCSHIEKLTAVFKDDIMNPETELCQACLQSLGHCLYQQQIARTFTESDSKVLLRGLAKVISTTDDKGICTRALWCIAKQNLPENIVSDQISVILSSIECALKKNLQSTTVDNEAICVVDRFLQQLPDTVMIKNAAHWSKLVFPMTVSSAGKVREYSLAIVSSHLNKIISAREEILPWFLPILKSGFIGELSKLCSEKKELFVLRVWSCIVPVLGKALHRCSLINDILKLVEQGFKNPSVCVQVESYFAWQVLIDNFATNQDVLSAPKRVNLIMMPLLNSAVKERNEKVEAARLSTWWHFVCAFESKRLLDLFEKVCIPLLQYLFGTTIDHISLLKSKEGFGDLKCPPTPTNGKFISNSLFETPKATARRSLRDVGTPKTPTVIHAGFAKATKDKLLMQGCEILEKILSVDGSSPANIRFTLEDKLQGAIFQSTEAFEKHAKMLINAVREAFKVCGNDLEDSLAMSIWGNLVAQVEKVVLKERNSLFESHFLLLLATAEELIDGSYISTVTSLKMLEIVSKLSPRIISHHCASLHSEGNPQGSTAILLLHLLLSPILFKDGQNNERLFLAFESLLSCGIDTPSGQLTHIQAILQLLQNTASFSGKKHSLWRLWSLTVSKLNEHIIKNNEVNQGNALEHDFTAIYLALLFPAKELLSTSLGQGEIKSINKDLNELYRSFSCAAALVPSVDSNTCAEELCHKLLDNWTADKAQDISFLNGMANLVTTIFECMDYAVAPVFAGKSPIKSPSKWAKKLEHPLGNMIGAVEVMRRLLVACCDMIESKKTSNNSGMLAALLTNLIDSLSMFYQHINGASLIAAAIKSLSFALVPIVQSSHTSTKEPKSGVEKAIFTSKFIQKVEKLWLDILTSVQSRHGGPYSSELLAIMSPLLEVTFVHLRRQLKNQTIIFWNATFANSQALEYPEKLSSILLSIKDKANLTLPGLKSTEVSLKEIQPEMEIEEISQITQPQGSPVRTKPLIFFGGSPKVKGSFLHKAAEAERAVEKNSPKKSWTEPRLPFKGKSETRNMHARRKLPLSLLDDDSQDFVRIAPSPTKKRLLTEHQKEVMREKSDVPALYNCLDQSQDAFYPTQESLMCTPSPIEEAVAPFENIKLPDSKNKDEEEQRKDDENDAEAKKTTDVNRESSSHEDKNVAEEIQKISEIPETVETDLEEVLATTTSSSCQETPVKNQPMTSSLSSPSHMDEDSESKEDETTSPDVIPSSQVSSGSPCQFKSLRRSGCAPVNSMVVLLKDVNEKEIKSKQDTCKTDAEPVKEQLEVKEEPINTETNGSQGNETEVEKDETNKVMSSRRKKKATAKGFDTSPIAGRTRRGRQLKLETPKKDNVENDISEEVTESSLDSQENSKHNPSEDSSEQQESEGIDDRLDLEEANSEPEPEVAKKPEAGQTKSMQALEVKSKVNAQTLLSKDVMSSPVSSAKIRFMKPNTGSPTQPSSVRTFQSPVSSPTTGILKRCTGRYDSPSPPNKVRRVSFAMPLAQEAHEKETNTNPLGDKPTVIQPEKTDSSSNEPESTPSKASDTFTIIKRRRKTPSSLKEVKDTSSCIYPDLVNCNLPVEQILPSLCSFTWSRGLGHVIHAQNIRTIGNLSSLKEYQIKNLPIRSPKVQTLKTALTTFHHKTKGLKSKSAKDMTALSGKEKKMPLNNKTIETNFNCPTILESEDSTPDGNDNIRNDQEKQASTTDKKTDNTKEFSEEKGTISENEENNKTEVDILDEGVEEEKNEECVEGEKQQEQSENADEDQIPCVCAMDEQETMDLSEKVVLLPENSEELEQSERHVDKSFTPPLPPPEESDKNSNALDDESATPKRPASTNPTMLFTPTDDDSEENQAYNTNDLISKINEDLEKDTVVLNTEEAKENVNNTIEVDDDVMKSEENVDTDNITDVDVKDNEVTEGEPQDMKTQDVNESDKDKSSDVQIKETSPEETFYHSLNSILETATPEVLGRLSNEEIFLAHKNLTELMSRVVTALQEKLQTSCQQ